MYENQNKDATKDSAKDSAKEAANKANDAANKAGAKGAELLNASPAGKYLAATEGTNDWQNGLFSCIEDPMSCLFVWFCPSCSAGVTYEKAELGSCIVGCLLFTFLSCCYPCIFTSKIREKKDIKGSMVTDVLLCCCCSCCQRTR